MRPYLAVRAALTGAEICPLLSHKFSGFDRSRSPFPDCPLRKPFQETETVTDRRYVGARV
jgi:hypothetical protein